MNRFFHWVNFVNKLIVPILIVVVVFNSSHLQASSDTDCPPPLTALISNTAALGCSAGIGNAVLNPYNDSRVNLLLAMTRPANNQTVKNSDFLYAWDFASNPIKSPFYIDSFQSSDSTEDEKRLHQSKFIELLHQLDLDENILNSNKQIYHTYKGRSLVPLADRVLSLYEIIKTDSKLNKADRRQVISYLLQLAPIESSTVNTKAYFDYITAANAFYADDQDTAEQIFALLANSGTYWVNEASSYNLIRVEIRKTQNQSGDRYGFFDIANVDHSQAEKILPAIQRYLNAYPKGRYTDSAKQLKRRAYWLNDDNNNLVKSYSDAINIIRYSNDFIAAAKLASEIDNKYLFTKLDQIEWDDPVIATTKILVRLRKRTSDNPVALDEIKSHESNFKQQNSYSLYKYLLTAYNFFKEEKYEAVIQETDNWRADLGKADYAIFSRAALRAEALGKLKRWKEAASLLKELRELSPSTLLKDHFELAQAQNLEDSGNIKKIFEPNSIIESPILRKRILRAAADTYLLEYVLDQKHISTNEKSIALASLLNKELLSKQYRSLLKHQKKYATLKLDNVDGLDLLRNETISSDDNYICPKWSKVLADLSGDNDTFQYIRNFFSEDKASPHALLCLGERFRTLEDGSIKLPNPVKDELGHSDDGFKTKSSSRLSLYLRVINDASAKDDDKAYALSRALYCFATSGSNHCGNEEISLEQRKAWFTKLKTKYKNSPWAVKQKNYW